MAAGTENDWNMERKFLDKWQRSSKIRVQTSISNFVMYINIY